MIATVYACFRVYRSTIEQMDLPPVVEQAEKPILDNDVENEISPELETKPVMFSGNDFTGRAERDDSSFEVKGRLIASSSF
jgi:hypothetical protein